MSKSILQAIDEATAFSKMYEEDYGKWEETYYQKGIEDLSKLFNDVDEKEFDAVFDDCVADDPSGETYINSIAYLRDNEPTLWYWVRENR